MSSRRQRSIPLGGRYRQVSLYNECDMPVQWEQISSHPPHCGCKFYPPFYPSMKYETCGQRGNIVYNHINSFFHRYKKYHKMTLFCSIQKICLRKTTGIACTQKFYRHVQLDWQGKWTTLWPISKGDVDGVQHTSFNGVWQNVSFHEKYINVDVTKFS